MSHQDSVSIWDHSRTVATNSCLGSQHDMSIDERNFLISDLGLFMQDQHITISCCILQYHVVYYNIMLYITISCCILQYHVVYCRHLYFWLTLNDVVETAQILL